MPRCLSPCEITCAVVSPSAVKLVARITSLHLGLAIRLERHPVEQFLQANVVRAHAVERAELAHQHEIKAL